MPDLESLFFFLFVIAIPVGLLLLGAGCGYWTAARHEANLARRMPLVAHVRVTDVEPGEEAVAGPNPPQLITSEVTLGIDHFRGFFGQLKNIVGGEIRSYQVVLDRARREAFVRLMEQAHGMGFNAIANVRVEFADVSGNAVKRRKAGMVSILASGTAYYAAGQ